MVVIVGGGISGLATAYYLGKAGIRSTLIEREARLGGVIDTEVIDGCVLEGGPDSFLAAKPWAMDLIRELGLAGEVIGSNDHLRKTYVWKRGRLVGLPDGLMFIAPTRLLPLVATRLLSWPTKLRMGMEWFRRPPTKAVADRSVTEFIGDHYGAEAVDYLAEPLLAGVYGGDPSQLSASSVLARFVELETRHGSITRGVLVEGGKTAGSLGGGTIFRTLKGGMGQLVAALQRCLRDSTHVLRADAEIVERLGGSFRIRAGGNWVEAAALVLACPAHETARLVSAVDPELAGLLNSIPYTSSMTVSLGYQKSSLQHPLEGFGFLVPKRERRRLVACTWVGTKFSHRVPETHALLRCFLGGAGDEAVLGDSDDAVVGAVREELRQIMDVTAAPLFFHIRRWPRSMAQYTVGHQQRVARIEERSRAVSGLHLVGNAYHGIGIPDCVRMAEQAAESIVASAGAMLAKNRSLL